MSCTPRRPRYKASMTLKCKDIDRVFKDAIDMHVHVAPDPDWDRRFTTLDTLRDCAANGMKGFVAKSFYYPTTTEALMATSVVEEDCTAWGSITIGYGTTGGLEHAPQIIRNHAKLGCKVIWFPAFDALYCNKGKRGFSILDDKGELLPEAVEILEICKEYNMVVCKGHMSFEETDKLFTKAREMGITKLVCTHPYSDDWGFFTDEQIVHLADLGAYIEIVFGNIMPRLDFMDPSDYVDLVHLVGAERMIMSTDWAQCMDPSPANGMRFFCGTMLQFGCTEEEVKLMACTNPAKLLDVPVEE